jgi:hypothetical protein
MTFAHTLPLGDAGRGFPFTEDETRRHYSYLSGTSMERNIEMIKCKLGEY